MAGGLTGRRQFSAGIRIQLPGDGLSEREHVERAGCEVWGGSLQGPGSRQWGTGLMCLCSLTSNGPPLPCDGIQTLSPQVMSSHPALSPHLPAPHVGRAPPYRVLRTPPCSLSFPGPCSHGGLPPQAPSAASDLASSYPSFGGSLEVPLPVPTVAVCVSPITAASIRACAESNSWS